MNKYVVVITSSFVRIEDFYVHEIEAENDKCANKQAILLAYDYESNNRTIDFVITRIHNNESIKPRKLTWKERLLGKLIT